MLGQNALVLSLHLVLLSNVDTLDLALSKSVMLSLTDSTLDLMYVYCILLVQMQYINLSTWTFSNISGVTPSHLVSPS